MKQAENIPVNTDKPGTQPNTPPVNAQEKQQHRHTDDPSQTPPTPSTQPTPPSPAKP